MTLLLHTIIALMGSSPDKSKNYFTLTGSTTPVELQRGGITANYSSQFVLYDPNKFASVRILNMEMEHPYQFSQYIVLADGNGVGSTANTFMTTVNEYSTSKPKPNLRLVSYGGTGKREDSAVSQFPGGFIGSAGKFRYVVHLLHIQYHNLFSCMIESSRPEHLVHSGNLACHTCKLV